MKRLVLLPLIVVAVLVAARPSQAFNVLSPSDAIIAIDLDFTTGSDSPGDPNGNNEFVENILDADPVTKYLNFGRGNVGFIVTPQTVAAVQSFNLTTANDADGRDPLSWSLFGTNDTITTEAHGNGRAENWTPIALGDLTLDNVPEARLTTGTAVGFSNASAYSSYKMIYPTTKVVDDIFQIGGVGFYSSMDGTGTNLLNPSAPLILPIRDADPEPSSNSPDGEAAPFSIDRDSNTKYLNFAKENSGFIVTPSAGATKLNGFQITTANDADARDPATYELYGTNEAITTPDNGIGDEQDWTLISSGDLNLPLDRMADSAEIPVSTSTAYTSYRMVFPTLRDSGGANSMQIAEVALLVADQAKLEVNRQTGEAVLTATDSIQFQSYELRSPNSNNLDETAWTSIASTGADPNDTWVETSATSDLLAEEDGPDGANDGFSLASGATYDLGEVWSKALPTEFEDFAASFQSVAGGPVGVEVSFVGTEIPLGDYSGNGTVGIEDWPAFKAVYGSNNSGMSEVESYLNGDLDGDFDSDISDFNLFVESAGGALALFGQPVPEPTSLLLLGGVLLGGLGMRRVRHARQAVAIVALVGATCVLSPTSAEAQTGLGFANVGGAPVATSIPTGQEDETAESGPVNFFDDDFLDDPGIIDGELFLLDYNDPDLQGGPFLQYAGLGGDPKTVFFDYGSSVTANWFAYSQRSGNDATADRVGMFELWFSNTPFNDVVPTSDPDSVVQILPTDNRLRDSALRPYSLSGSQSGRYVAMRLTQSELSASQPVTNIGGHEFRLLDGPSDVVLEVNRATGALTLKNDLSGSVGIEIKSYTIESPAGALDESLFDGLGGDNGAFPLASWDIGGGSNANRLAEGRYSGVSTLASGTSGLSLGDAYKINTLAEDLQFTWTNSNGHMYGARVTYVGVAPEILWGDYNDNGIVDAADYTAWRDALGTSTLLPNDITPGEVDQSDYVVWQGNYGETDASPPGAAIPAPEPGSLLLCLVGASALVARRRVGK